MERANRTILERFRAEQLDGGRFPESLIKVMHLTLNPGFEVTHTSLTIQRAQYMLYNRMLQYIARPISEERPHAIRAPDEGVVDLVRACLPFVEMGMFEFFPITAP